MPNQQSQDIAQAIAQAKYVKQRHEASLLELDGVVGVGIGIKLKAGQLTGQVAIVVNVRRKISRAALSPSEVIPSELDGIPVDVVETGIFSATDKPA